MEVHWYTAASGGEEIFDPTLNELGQVTYYAEALDPSTGCTSSERTPVHLEYASCGMVLSKEAPAMDGVDCNPLEIGDLVAFTFTLVNSGSAPIGQVELSDPLLSDEPLAGPQSGDLDGDGLLDAGEVWFYQASYALNSADKEEGWVVNVATAHGTVFQTSGEFMLETTGSTAFPVCNAPGIEILKTSSLAGEDCKALMVGDQVPYRFEVTNTGDLPLTEIRIIDPLLDEPEIVYQDNGGILFPGRVWVVDEVITIRQQHIDEGGIWNTAQVFAESALGSVEDTSKTVEVLLCQEGELALLKEAYWGAGAACGQVGDLLLYQFELLNTGNTVLENIRINDPLLGGDLGGPVSGDTDEDGKLDIDEIWVYSATYALGQDDLDRGWVENQALALAFTVSGLEVLDRSGTTFDNDLPTISQVCTASGIGLVQTIELIDSNQNGCADEGETLWFEFKIKNLGTTTLFDVVVSEPTLDISGELPELAPGVMDELSFYGSYVISGTDLENGLLTFSSQVTAVDTRGVKWTDRSHPESFSEDAASDFSSFCQGQSSLVRMELALTGEWLDDNGDGNSQEGETIGFLAEIRNTGDVPIFSIALEEEQPNGLEISGESIVVLQPGETDSLNFEVTYSIGMPDIEEGEVVARLLASGTTSEGDIIEVLSDDPTDNTNMDSDGDGLPDDPTRVVLPRVLAESAVAGEIPLEIFNGISPDGDGLNDYMQINGIENYPQNNFKVFNRWGVQVFEIDGYDNVSRRFEGISEGRTTIRQGERLPAGTYYYVLTFSGDNPGQQAYTGYLYINRN
jgi:gliding motility-associated-like protein